MSKALIPKAILDQHTGIIGKTGSGKTSTAKAAIVEPLLEAERQVAIVDPTSAWWGLRHSADGKSKGFDIVQLGGERGDLPLSERSGEAVARLITEQGVSCIIDTGSFTVGEYTRWFIAFATALYTTIKHPLHLVIDEAHQFMPQGKSPDIDAGRMLHAGNRLMSGGRSRGIRGVLITQRPAKLHKDSLTCVDCLIAHRVVAPQDRAAVKDWIDGAGDASDGKRVIDSLASLNKGEAWVWYPEGNHLQRTQFPMPLTFDSSKAPTSGSRAPKAADIDLSKIKSAMADAVKEAEANDPKKLRAKIAELEKAVKMKQAPTAAAVDPKAIEAAELKGRRAGASAFKVPVREMETSLVQITKNLDEQVRRVETIRMSLTAMHALMDSTTPVPAGSGSASIGGAGPVNAGQKELAPQRAVREAVQTFKRESRATGNGQAPGNREQRFLDAAAALQTLNAEVTRETVSGWVGVHPRGGSVGEVLKALADSGMIEMDRGRITVTDAGLAAANDVDPTAAIESAKAGLTNRQRQFFETIVEAYPGPISREAIAERFSLHARGGSLGEDLGRLVGRGLVSNSRGAYTAREFLFAGGGA